MKTEKCAQILITFCPMPTTAQQDYQVTSASLSPDFEVTEPIVTGQCARNGGQLVKLSFAVFPAPTENRPELPQNAPTKPQR